MHANVASLPHCTWLASRHATPRCTIQCTTGIRKAHDGLACRPKIEHELDLSNFDNEFTEAKPNFLDSVGGPGALGGSDTAFAGFTFKATDFSMMKVGIALFSPASPRRTVCSVVRGRDDHQPCRARRSSVYHNSSVHACCAPPCHGLLRAGCDPSGRNLEGWPRRHCRVRGGEASSQDAFVTTAQEVTLQVRA